MSVENVEHLEIISSQPEQKQLLDAFLAALQTQKRLNTSTALAVIAPILRLIIKMDAKAQNITEAEALQPLVDHLGWMLETVEIETIQ